MKSKRKQKTENDILKNAKITLVQIIYHRMNYDGDRRWLIADEIDSGLYFVNSEKILNEEHLIYAGDIITKKSGECYTVSETDILELFDKY